LKLIQKGDPREADSIQLGRDSYLDRLYGVFRFDNPRADGFQTEREEEIISRNNFSSSTTRIRAFMDLPRFFRTPAGRPG